MKMLDVLQSWYKTWTLLNIIRTSSSESHTLRACFFQKEYARKISIVSALGCQNTPEIYIKHL